jgi:hypothetical protein
MPSPHLFLPFLAILPSPSRFRLCLTPSHHRPRRTRIRSRGPLQGVREVKRRTSMNGLGAYFDRREAEKVRGKGKSTADVPPLQRGGFWDSTQHPGEEWESGCRGGRAGTAVFSFLLDYVSSFSAVFTTAFSHPPSSEKPAPSLSPSHPPIARAQPSRFPNSVNGQEEREARRTSPYRAKREMGA